MAHRTIASLMIRATTKATILDTARITAGSSHPTTAAHIESGYQSGSTTTALGTMSATTTAATMGTGLIMAATTIIRETETIDQGGGDRREVFPFPPYSGTEPASNGENAS